MSNETYYLCMAVMALKNAMVYMLEMDECGDTLPKLCKQLTMVDRAVEQAGLHVIMEDE